MASVIITYFVLALLVTLLATGRRISFAGAFTINLVFTPIIGLLTILKSQKNIIIKHYRTRYVCPECHRELNNDDHYCELCNEMGKIVKPEKKKFFINE